MRWCNIRKMMYAWGMAIVVSAAGMLAGCGGLSAIYRDSSSAGSSVTPKRTWKAGGAMVSPASAIDGNMNTAATAPLDYSGKFILIDLRKPCTLNMIAMDHGLARDGYARLIEVSISMDGSEYLTVYTGLGTRRISTIVLPRPVLTRYIRLRAVRSGPEAWNIAEINIQ